MPSGSISSRYSSVVQVRASFSISPMRVSQPAAGPGCMGRRGMRSPVTASSSRPSPREMTRVTPMKARKNGMPMMRMPSPTDSDRPVTTTVKYRMPVASVSSI